jgi:hypothetical protein
MSEQETPIIRVSLDLRKGGVKNTTVSADTPETRDEAIERLCRCLPQIESLESALKEDFIDGEEPRWTR